MVNDGEKIKLVKLIRKSVKAGGYTGGLPKLPN